MPAISVFVDSNVFLYARDLESAHKAEASNRWLRKLIAVEAARTNLQVLNEIANVMLRRKRDVPPEAIFADIDGLAFIGDAPIAQATVVKARALHLRYRYSWWDCLLLASAIHLGCTHFLSEDLQDGQAIEGLTIVSPFAHTPEHILASR